jgi:hypothetical protein
MRLQSTTIEIPADPAVQNYILIFTDKVRPYRTFKYEENLATDAKCLGLSLHKLPHKEEREKVTDDR